MAQIGLKYFAVAPVSAYSAGSEPTYGTGMKVGHLMKADLTWNRGDVKLFGDNIEVERDNSITSGQLTIGTTYLSKAGRLMLLDEAEFGTPGTGEPQEYATGGDPGPVVGCGYVWKDSADGGTAQYIAYWYYRVQFSMNETMNTKGENTEYGTPELVGEIMGCQPASSLETKFRKYAYFTTEADAIAWLKAIAGIT